MFNVTEAIKNLKIIKGWAGRSAVNCFYRLRFFYNFLIMKSRLSKLIKNQRILIIGSGSSVADLKNIPDDVKIFTCKRSIKTLVDRNINKEIDLYLCNKKSLLEASPGWGSPEELPGEDSLSDLILRVKINLFITDNVKWGKTICDCVVWDRTRNDYFLKKIIKPKTIEEIAGNGLKFTSAGVRLLQYAMFFQAREVYLIGIDLGLGGYFWDEKIDVRKENIIGHVTIDLNFVKLMSEKHGNVYSVSQKSPLSQYIPYKPLN